MRTQMNLLTATVLAVGALLGSLTPSGGPVTIAQAQSQPRTFMGRSMCTLAPQRRRAMSRTGCRPRLTSTGSSCSASTARSPLFSTSRGAEALLLRDSEWLPERLSEVTNSRTKVASSKFLSSAQSSLPVPGFVLFATPLGMAAICAKRTAPVDVERPLWTTADVAVGERHSS
jgi:hypothetical protein